MAKRISSTDLVRTLGDVLGRVRYGSEEFIVEKHSMAIAIIGPARARKACSVEQLAGLWRGSGSEKDSFADDLERINAQDRSPTSPRDL